MSKVERFEDLIAWQKARLLTKAIYEVTRQGNFVKDFGLSGQMQRASVSIMSNIAEGNERGRTNEYYNFLGIAKGSCAELRSQIYTALDIGYIDSIVFQQLKEQAEEVARLV